MSTIIFNPQGEQVGKGKNLGIMFAHARKRGGVKSIKVRKDKHSTFGDGAFVWVTFADGFVAETRFVSHSHAQTWALSKTHTKGSWWYGAELINE